MDRTSLIFCILSLIITIGLISFFYSKATIPMKMITNWKEPAHAEDLPDIKIGDFGKVSIGDLINYYIENPPTPSNLDEIPAREVRFKGC
jgi:hypothetical protein